jgi:hypothetical protein
MKSVLTAGRPVRTHRNTEEEMVLTARAVTCFFAALALPGLPAACVDPPTVLAPSSSSPPAALQPQANPPSLKGVVFENTVQGRHPISGARVEVSDLIEGPYRNYPWYATSSETNGLFRVSVQALSGRVVRLTARAGPGLYQLCAVHPTIGADTTADIELAAPGVSLACGSPNLSGIAFEATPEGRRPVAGVPVWYFSFAPHDAADVYTRTDAQGRYAFGGLPPSPGELIAGCSPGDLRKNRFPVDIHRDTVLDVDVALSTRDCF